MLYDLKNDPDQLKDLSKDPEHKETLDQMRELTDNYLKQYARPEIEKLKKEALERESRRKKR